MIKMLIITLMFCTEIVGQNNDPNVILDEMRRKFSLVEDYEVEAEIRVDVNFLKVPASHAKIYFKQPDKVKLESEGFALLPKQGLNFSPGKLLKENYNALYVRSEIIDDSQVDVVKVIPISDTTDVILSTLWIDSKEYVLRKIETTTKRTGTFEILLKYEKKDFIVLPSEVEFTFNFKDVRIPRSIGGDTDDDKEENKKAILRNEPLVGSVTIIYSNYKINNGIPDSFFDED